MSSTTTTTANRNTNVMSIQVIEIALTNETSSALTHIS